MFYEGKIIRLVYNHGALPTRTNDRSACIKGASDGFLRNQGVTLQVQQSISD